MIQKVTEHTVVLRITREEGAPAPSTWDWPELLLGTEVELLAEGSVNVLRNEEG